MDTTEYDRIIRTYIPHYDESRGVQLDLLAAALPHSATRIVDLGGGTGSLAEAIRTGNDLLVAFRTHHEKQCSPIALNRGDIHECLQRALADNLPLDNSGTESTFDTVPFD